MPEAEAPVLEAAAPIEGLVGGAVVNFGRHRTVTVENGLPDGCFGGINRFFGRFRGLCLTVPRYPFV